MPSLTTYFYIITERSIKLLSSVMLISTNRIKVLRLWLTCFEDWPISILTLARRMLKKKKRNIIVCWKAFLSLPPPAPLAFLSRLRFPFPSLSNVCHASYFPACLLLSLYCVFTECIQWKWILKLNQINQTQLQLFQWKQCQNWNQKLNCWQ